MVNSAIRPVRVGRERGRVGGTDCERLDLQGKAQETQTARSQVMTSISALDLGRKVIEALSLTPGQTIEFSKLKNGAVLLSKPDEAGARQTQG
jgi:hypothetical protein